MSTSSYDLVQYPYSIRPSTHIARLGAIARLMGHPAPDVRTCKVLEIGGGDGVNLINMALGLPDAQFLSVDLSERASGYGDELLRLTGVTNVSLELMDLRDLPATSGPFDYVIAHGVYAWVPQEVRDAILSLLNRMLSPNGIAMISYNTLPGCRPRQAIRDLLLHATRDVQDPAQRIAAGREALEFYLKHWETKRAVSASLNDEARSLLRRPAGLMFHDEMGDCYFPQLVSDVAMAASRHGLQYLCDTQLGLLSEALWPGDLFDTCRPLSAGDFVQFEQVRDNIETRSFRQTLLCRSGTRIDRAFSAGRARDLYLDGQIERVSKEDAKPGEYVFSTRHGDEFSTHDPRLAEALSHLSRIFPDSVRLGDLLDQPALIEAMTNIFLLAGVEFSTTPFPVRTALSTHPRASRLARAEVSLGLKDVSSLRHTQVALDEPGKRFIELLDGTRTVPDLARDLAPVLNVDVDEARRRVEGGLQAYNRMALIEG